MVFFHIAAAVLCVAQVATPLPTNEAAIANNHSFPKTVTIDLGILSKAVALNITEVPSSLPSGVARVRREVIDSESRVLWTDRGFPNSAIGRVVWATGEVCSGTLVGPRHVITAAQCIAPTGISMSFQPAYAGGETYPSSDVSLSVLPPTNPIDCWEDDYAVLILSDRLGDDRGYFGAHGFNHKTHLQTPDWYHMGYPSDLGDALMPYRQSQIRVNDIISRPSCPALTGALSTDADMSTGQFGGPLWLGPEWDSEGNRYVTAVASRAESGYTIFAAGSPGSLSSFVYAAREQYDY